MRFSFSTAGRIEFGDGVAGQAVPELVARGIRRVALVTGATAARSGWLSETLNRAGISFVRVAVAGEPTVAALEAALAAAREARSEAVAGLGGGSVLDMAKAVGALLNEDGAPRDYLEIVGAGRKVTAAPAPVIAIPTTAGTGAEVTRNAVLGVPERGLKVSLRGPQLLPALALVDPALTQSLPPRPTAETGLDALTQVIEPYLSPFATPLTDALCRDAIPRALAALPRAVARPDDAEARRDMALASLFGGLALANAKLGAVHGLAGVIGGRTGHAHGAICGRLLPGVLAANDAAVGEAEPTRGWIEEVRRWVAAAIQSELEDAWAALGGLVDRLGVPGLAAGGLGEAEIPEVARLSMRASSMQGNPVELDEARLAAILRAAL